MKFFWIGIAFVIGLTVGSYVGMWQHPYNKCSHIYEDPLDISECVWLLENN